MATRRALLQGLASCLGVAACNGLIGQPLAGATYVGVETSAKTGLSQASFFTASGARHSVLPLSFRAHGITQIGSKLAVFPRRPGNRFALLNLDMLEIEAVITAPAGRHFYGHGAATVDGKTLLVPENDLETLQGRVGIYDLPSKTRIGEIALKGTGPHDIARDPDRDRFKIALGGLETHPDYGRTPLNLDNFQSDVLTLDLDRGTIDAFGEWHGQRGVSLRHLAQDAAGRLFVGGQVVVAEAEGQSVLWMVDNGEVTPLPASQMLNGYVSSIAADGDRVVATSKTANRALELRNGQVTKTTALTGASSVGMCSSVTAVSGFEHLRLNEVLIAVADGFEFDNHGLVLS